MYHKLTDFLSDWAYESEATLKILKNLTDESLPKKIGENVRTPGRLAWHITTAINEMISRTGISVDKTNHDEPVPATTAEIIKEYDRSSANLINELKANWTDDTLILEDDMYGEMWAKGKTLSVLITHQIHHRGQLTTLMRLSGLKVPGIYGPSKEEWVGFGMPPQE